MSATRDRCSVSRLLEATRLWFIGEGGDEDDATLVTLLSNNVFRITDVQEQRIVIES
jgi:hypothetical protein